MFVVEFRLAYSGCKSHLLPRLISVAGILSNGEKNLIAGRDGVNSKILVQLRKTSLRIRARQRWLRDAEKRSPSGFSCGMERSQQKLQHSGPSNFHMSSTGNAATRE